MTHFLTVLVTIALICFHSTATLAQDQTPATQPSPASSVSTQANSPVPPSQESESKNQSSGFLVLILFGIVIIGLYSSLFNTPKGRLKGGY